MGSAVVVRAHYSAAELLRLARRSKDTRQSSRLLSLAAVRDGMSRAEAARIGGMDRQTLRDWVHRCNEAGPDGLRDSWSSGPRVGGVSLPVGIHCLLGCARQGHHSGVEWAE